MSDSLKILGQLSPSANSLSDLYIVPVGMGATISSVTICNVSANQVTFNLAVAIGGAPDNTSQYIYFEAALDVGDTFIATIGITLAAGDVVRVLASENKIAFNLFGVEVS